MQVLEPPKVYPVVVVGSGASGGMAAWNLTRQGVEVVLLDAGDKFDRAKFWTHVMPWEERERRARGEHPPAFFLDTKEQPYVTPGDRPFDLVRVWGHGGKTNVWGRVSLRYSEMDLKASERDGWEIPWPISYKDIAPYYDQVEQLIGVCGGGDDDRHSGRGGAARQHDPAHPRLPGLPLLRGLRPRLRHRLVLQLGGPPAALRGEDRQAGDPLERGGGAHPGGRPRPRPGRPVLRPEDGGRARGAGQGRGGGRELRGLHAPAAQLEIRATPERDRQRLRRGRPLPLRADPDQRGRHPAD